MALYHSHYYFLGSEYLSQWGKRGKYPFLKGKVKKTHPLEVRLKLILTLCRNKLIDSIFRRVAEVFQRGFVF